MERHSDADSATSEDDDLFAMPPILERRTFTPESIGLQVAKIRAEIERQGFYRAGCEELGVLCPEVAGIERRAAIRQIAQWENWNSRVLADGDVRFSPISDR